jgi:hypothetical protein
MAMAPLIRSVLPVFLLPQQPTTKPNFMSGKNLTVARGGHPNGATGKINSQKPTEPAGAS